MKKVSKWIDTLKARDLVIIRRNSGDSIAKVLRITKTQVVTVTKPNQQERKWRRKDGYEVGSAGCWNKCLIVPADPESIEKMRHLRRLDVIQDYFSMLPVDMKLAKSVFEMIESEKKKTVKGGKEDE